MFFATVIYAYFIGELHYSREYLSQKVNEYTLMESREYFHVAKYFGQGYKIKCFRSRCL
jgi:hypothetical protein